ncbi:MAG: WD40 repeat domain-containing protein [Gemmataceae bacterium]
MAGNTAIYQVRFSPDGRRLAAGGSCRHVPVWDTATGQLVHQLGPHVDRVHRLAFSPDGRRLVCGSGTRVRGAAVVWDLPAGTRRHTFTDHKDAVDFVAYSPDGKRIATAGWDSRVFVYDAATGQSLRMLTGHVHDIAFAPDSRHLATAGVNQTIQIWDVDKGAVVSTLTGHTDEVGALAFDGHARLASAGMDTAIRVWDWRTGELLHIIRGAGYRVQQLAFSPGGDRLASSGPSVRVWNPEADQDARRIARFTERFALAPDGRLLATVTAETHAVTLWDTRTGLPRFTLPGTSARPPALAFAAGGTVLAVASVGGDVQLVDPADGRIRHTLRHAGVRLVAFHPDGRTLATVAQRKKESELRLWDVADGKLRQRWPLGVIGVRSLGFADGGRLLVVGGRSGDTGRLLVVDSATGEVVRQRDGDAWESLACDPAGARLALASLTGETTLRDTESGTAALTVPTAARAIAFSPDGQRLATANRAITLWESASGLESLTLTVPRRALTDCYFTDTTRRTFGVFFTQVEVATDAVAGRTCEGSVWLWTPHTPPPRPVRTTVVPIARLPSGEVPDAALAAYGIRVGGMGKMMRHEPTPLVHLPLGLAAFQGGTTAQLRQTRVLTFDQPVRGVALTVAGLQGGASIAIWRLEALDASGQLLATTGEPEYSKDPLPRTYRLRADGIAAVRWVTDNRGIGDQAWATFTSPPVVEIVLER